MSRRYEELARLPYSQWVLWLPSIEFRPAEVPKGHSESLRSPEGLQRFVEWFRMHDYRHTLQVRSGSVAVWFWCSTCMTSESKCISAAEVDMLPELKVAIFRRLEPYFLPLPRARVSQ